jgi:hypothetical protein
MDLLRIPTDPNQQNPQSADPYPTLPGVSREYLEYLRQKLAEVQGYWRARLKALQDESE